MPLETAVPAINNRMVALNNKYGETDARDILEQILNHQHFGRLTMVSSFGEDSIALLHIISQVNRNLPILFLDTELLFAQTLTYQVQVAEHLGLTDVRIIRPDRDATFTRDLDGMLHQSDPDACCILRKTEPLQNALTGFDGWITGRKRFQGQQRRQMQVFENDSEQRIKVNPLAHWEPARIATYISNHKLPRHPLVAGGFASIGCQPCTTRVAAGEDTRAGRWRGREKTECGIHFAKDRAEPRNLAA